MRVNPFPPVAAIVEAQTLTIDFGSRLPAGVTLTGVPTVVLSSMDGSDSNPQSRIVGSPVIGVAPPPNGTGVANAAVLFQVANCVAGTLYGVKCYCQATSGDTPDADTTFLCYTPD